MSTADRDKWNEKYSRKQPESILQVDEWLIVSCETIEHWEPEVTRSRRAIDIACGLGQNSIWLAQHGWDVDGVDVSATGLKLASQVAAEVGTAVNWLEADLDDWHPEPDSYDLAIVFRFLDRKSVPEIIDRGLRSGGWLVYETFAAGQLERSESHIHNPAFTLQPDELPKLFSSFEVVQFREDSLADRTVQRLLARKH